VVVCSSGERSDGSGLPVWIAWSISGGTLKGQVTWMPSGSGGSPGTPRQRRDHETNASEATPPCAVGSVSGSMTLLLDDQARPPVGDD
jgi:hypothetical protein